MRVIDETGNRYGRLVVEEAATERIGGQVAWVCRCDCGGRVTVRGASLRTGNTTSCGCYRREVERANGLSSRKHGKSETPAYRSWRSMLTRCSNPNTEKWQHYGGRGIRVCKRWDPAQGGSFVNFLADMGERPEGMSLDRIDPDGNYEPSNCRWATAKEQRANRRKIRQKHREKKLAEAKS